MLRWCRSGWLVPSLASLVVGVAGCHAGDQRIDPGYKPDLGSLMNLPGAMPATAARAQKPQQVPPSPLELGPVEPGSRETRGARIRATVNDIAILDEEVVAAAFQQLMTPNIDEATKAEVMNKKLTEIIERELLLQEAKAKLGKRPGFMDELKKAANKEFDKQWLYKLMIANQQKDPVEFKRFLED